MTPKPDSQLLLAYAERRSEAAFTELVRRHVDLVHSAALRITNDPHLAKDVAQGVFAALARQAGSLAGHGALVGWLHRTTRNIAAHSIRTESRRRMRERQAAAMNQTPDSGDSSWQQIAPFLDAALADLATADRDAILLRYFENKSTREVADQLAISTEAAQKRRCDQTPGRCPSHSRTTQLRDVSQPAPRQASRCTMSGEKAGKQTATYSAPSVSGDE